MSAALDLLEIVTLDSFQKWQTRGGLLWQLVDGMPMAMAPASPIHAAIQGEVAGLLRDHLLAKGSSCIVMGTPGVIPRVQSDINLRIPDLGVTCTQPEVGDKAMRDPVLLVEILSPSNHAETWSNVWSYTTIPSVREILVLYSDKVRADLLRRDAEGNWPDRPETIETSDLTLSSIDYSGPVAAFYRTTPLRPG